MGLLLHPTPLFTQRGLPNIPCSQTAAFAQNRPLRVAAEISV